VFPIELLARVLSSTRVCSRLPRASSSSPIRSFPDTHPSWSAHVFLVERCDQLLGHCFTEHLIAVTSILLF